MDDARSPQLSESVLAELRENGSVFRWLVELDAEMIEDHETNVQRKITDNLIDAVCAAYSAYLARTPLENLTLEMPEAEVFYLTHVAATSKNEGTALRSAGMMARDIFELKRFAASLQERIAALESALELQKGGNRADAERLAAAELKVFGDNTFGCDAADWMAEEVLGLRTEVAALTAERDALSTDYRALQDSTDSEVERLRAENAEARQVIRALVDAYHDDRGPEISILARADEILENPAARTPPVPEDTKNG